MALNTLAYLATILIVFQYARRYAQDASIPWLAAGAFAFGGFTIEYALGLWPQAFSFALCTTGVAAAGRVIDDESTPGGKISAATVAGFLLALATGVRYQNAVVVAAVGGALLLLASARRWKACAAYVAAAAIPLAVSAAVNHARFDSWNPISKGPGYLSVPVSDGKSALFDPLVMFWGQVVDYSWRPELTDRFVRMWLHYDPGDGRTSDFRRDPEEGGPAVRAVGRSGVPDRSAPRGSRRRGWTAGAANSFACCRLLRRRSSRRFRCSGAIAHDGLSFNARYLLELVPIGRRGVSRGRWTIVCRRGLRPLAAGAALGGVLVGVIVFGTPMLGGPETSRSGRRANSRFLKTPLVLAAALAGVWLLDVWGRPHPTLLVATMGACLGWGFALHLSTDVGMSQFMRATNAARTQTLADVVPDGSAVVAHWGNTNAVVPLTMTRNVVILDASADECHDAPMLIRDLLAKNRKVFVLEEGFTRDNVQRLRSGLDTVALPNQTLPLSELRTDSTQR